MSWQRFYDIDYAESPWDYGAKLDAVMEQKKGAKALACAKCLKLIERAKNEISNYKANSEMYNNNFYTEHMDEAFSPCMAELNKMAENLESKYSELLAGKNIDFHDENAIKQNFGINETGEVK